jgi:hypothetical protein
LRALPEAGAAVETQSGVAAAAAAAAVGGAASGSTADGNGGTGTAHKAAPADFTTAPAAAGRGESNEAPIRALEVRLLPERMRVRYASGRSTVSVSPAFAALLDAHISAPYIMAFRPAHDFLDGGSPHPATAAGNTPGPASVECSEHGTKQQQEAQQGRHIPRNPAGPRQPPPPLLQQQQQEQQQQEQEQQEGDPHHLSPTDPAALQQQLMQLLGPNGAAIAAAALVAAGMMPRSAPISSYAGAAVNGDGGGGGGGSRAG